MNMKTTKYERRSKRIHSFVQGKCNLNVLLTALRDISKPNIFFHISSRKKGQKRVSDGAQFKILTVELFDLCLSIFGKFTEVNL